MVLTSETEGVLCGTDPFLHPFSFVRNMAYSFLGCGYSARNLVLENGFIGEGNLIISLRVLNSIVYCRYALGTWTPQLL